MNEKSNTIKFFPGRFYLLLSLLLIFALIVMSRLVYLTVFSRSFLLKQGNSRHLRIIEIPAYRGMILDRDGEPLAVSTPVFSVWINPQDFANSNLSSINRLSQSLGLTSKQIATILRHNAKREFAYLKRGVSPEIAQKIQQLSVAGVYVQREYRRYYPQGEVTSQVVGFTNVDDQGQEGFELAYNGVLRGVPGHERVLKDLYGKVVGKLDVINVAKAGKDVTLSINSKIQFLAYKALKEVVNKYHAKSGSVIVLDPKTGEILAMANQPTFNNNKRPVRDPKLSRNRAVVDLFEPGSTMKTFSVVSALATGKYYPNTFIDTRPGYFMIGRNKVVENDDHKYGVISVTEVLQKSSNVGVAKMTLASPGEKLVDTLRRFGFGTTTGSGFPGEAGGGITSDFQRPFVLATLSFGYALTTTALQLTSAYGVIANDGKRCPITFLKVTSKPRCQQVIAPNVAKKMLLMLETVVGAKDSTGNFAIIEEYRVAGKTGTARIAGRGGYDKKRLIASFIGMAPVSDPKLVIAVIINEPKGRAYGGTIAAPAFAKIMHGSLRLLNVMPDGK